MGHPRHRRPDRASSREDLDDPRETRPRGRPAAGIRPRHELQVLEHRLHPARPDHRAGHRSLVAARGLTTRDRPAGPDAAHRCPPPGIGRCRPITRTPTAEVDGRRVDQPASTPRWPAPPAATRSSPPSRTSPASSMRCSRASCSATATRCGRCWPSPRHPTGRPGRLRPRNRATRLPRRRRGDRPPRHGGRLYRLRRPPPPPARDDRL